MMKNKQMIYQIKRSAMTSIYVGGDELLDLLNNLTTKEVALYTILKTAPLRANSIEYFDDSELGKLIGSATTSVAKMRSVLKRKGYALITRFRDERDNPMLKVIVGSDQMELYRLGLDITITDTKVYNALCSKFGLDVSGLSDDDKRECISKMVKSFDKGEC